MSAQDIPTRIRDWLASTLEESGLSQTSLARGIGLSSSAVSRVLSGDRQLSVSELRDTVRFFGKEDDLTRLLDLDPLLKEAAKKEAIIASTKFSLERSLFDDPLDDLKTGILAKQAIPIRSYDDEHIKFEIPGLFLSLVRDLEGLRWKMVLDEAMEPTLRTTDVVIFDTNSTVPALPALYVVENGFGGALVRRLEVESFAAGERSPVRVICDNTAYATQTVPYDQIRIVGRVRGVYRAML